MKNNIIKLFVGIAAASLLLSAVTGCDKNDYAKINTDPAKIGEGNVPYLFTQAYLEFEPSSYLYWFYISKITKPLVQATGGSRTDRYNVMGELGGIGTQFVAVRKYEKEIADVISRMSEEDAAKYQNIQAAVNAMSVYLAVLDSDLYGSIPYTESCEARYGGTLTPNYDTQRDLFNALISEIDADIAVLSQNLDGQVMGSQDPVYKGNASKWLKFANGVKLKIAIRLLHQDKATALRLAQEVGASDANIMTVEDSFIYNKGASGANDMGDYAFHFGNGVEGMGSARKEIIDFMKKNTDPRMLVMFSKNSFNAEVVQAFFDAEIVEGNTSAIPAYVLENINYTTDAETGKKTFVSWKGAGEPWVRYYGVPVGLNISEKPEYRGDNNYFDSGKLILGDKSYAATSSFTERLVRGRVGTYTFPTKPGVVSQITEYSAGMPWYGMAMSAGEINLYLAELKLAGASLPKTAAEYFKAGVRASAKDYNTYATLNKIPYTTKAYCYSGDPLDAPTSYGEDKINAMLDKDDYQLTGDHQLDLEKVYVQQFLHFMYQPVEQFVSARRGGVPMVNSTLIPWCEDFDATKVPRRLYVAEPTLTDVMREIKLAAYAEEGFTCTRGESFQTLHDERVWYDKGAPEFGAGPNL